MDVSSYTVFDETLWQKVGAVFAAVRGKLCGQVLSAGPQEGVPAVQALGVGAEALLDAQSLEDAELGTWVVGAPVEGVSGSVFARKGKGPNYSQVWRDANGQTVSVGDLEASLVVAGTPDVGGTFEIVSVVQTGKPGRFLVLARGLSGSMSGREVPFYVEPQGALSELIGVLSVEP